MVGEAAGADGVEETEGAEAVNVACVRAGFASVRVSLLKQAERQSKGRRTVYSAMSNETLTCD